MATLRQPDRAVFDTPQGAVVAVRDHNPGFGAADSGKKRGPRVVLGEKTLTPSEAIGYRDAITAALHWLGALDDDLQDDGAIPEPCRAVRAFGGQPCPHDEGHDGAHQFYAHVSDDPWAASVDADQLGDFND